MSINKFYRYKIVLNNHKKIDLANKTIAEDKENEKYEVASQKKKTNENINSLNSDIEQNKQITKENKHGIQINKKKIKLLEKKQQAIQDGSFKMPEKQHIAKIR